MEYLDLYDKNRKFTGKTIRRTNKKGGVPKGSFITIVIIFIKNSKDEFLFQMTSKNKGSVWATTGGHVKAGQTSKEGIIEEVREELGIDISLEKFELVETVKWDFAFMDVYFLEKDIDIKTLTIQEEEVEYVKWLSVSEIKELIKDGKVRTGNIRSFENIINKKGK